jgi:hypothetical protein
MARTNNSATSGEKYGKLTLTYFDNERKKWVCQCECGGVRYAHITDLRNSIRLACKDCSPPRPNRRFPDQMGLKRKLYRRYVSGAKKRGILFELTLQNVVDITQQSCYYCGTVPNTEMRMVYDTLLYNGIDRVDNNKGYTLDNVVPCCSACNYSKKEHSLEQWKIWLERAYKHQFNK